MENVTACFSSPSPTLANFFTRFPIMKISPTSPQSWRTCPHSQPGREQTPRAEKTPPTLLRPRWRKALRSKRCVLRVPPDFLSKGEAPAPDPFASAFPSNLLP